MEHVHAFMTLILMSMDNSWEYGARKCRNGNGGVGHSQLAWCMPCATNNKIGKFKRMILKPLIK